MIFRKEGVTLKYTVRLWEIYQTYVEVEAPNEEEAKARALDTMDVWDNKDGLGVKASIFRKEVNAND